MLLYHKYNLVMIENVKIGSNPYVVMLTALRGGGGGERNLIKSFGGVAQFKYKSGGIL